MSVTNDAGRHRGATPRIRASSTNAESCCDPRLVLAHRDDPLVPHLDKALKERYRVVADLDAEVAGPRRLLVAAATFRPSRQAWGERFIKSNIGVALRSRQVARALASTRPPFDVVFQTHALFEVSDPRTVIYVDCTHRQSAEHWPAWNPLRGRGLARWYARERRQYQSAAHVFAFSRPTMRSLVDDYGVPADRVSVVGAGLNFEELPPPAAPRSPRKSPTILFVGNDFVRKGGPELLEAFRLLRTSIPDAVLRIVGTPYPIVPQPGVEVLGLVNSRAELSALYSDADVFCLPSFFEPFGLVILEAMAHGLPCVVTPTCGVPEIVLDGETGLMTEPGSELVASLTAKLTRLLSDRDLAARMGASGRRRVAEQFLWPHVVDRMANVLDSLPGRLKPGISVQPPTPTQGA